MREEIVYIKNFIQQERMLEDLLNELPLKQEEINLGFKKVHADNEPEMDDTCIASVSLGAPRRFLVKNNISNDITEYELGNGDLLLMYGCQKTYQHSIPKTKKQVLPRLSLTFRNII